MERTLMKKTIALTEKALRSSIDATTYERDEALKKQDAIVIANNIKNLDSKAYFGRDRSIPEKQIGNYRVGNLPVFANPDTGDVLILKDHSELATLKPNLIIIYLVRHRDPKSNEIKKQTIHNKTGLTETAIYRLKNSYKPTGLLQV